jgi:hypothetical protein
VKLTNINEVHNGIQLKDGINTYLPNSVSITYVDMPEMKGKNIFLSKAIDFVKESDA